MDGIFCVWIFLCVSFNRAFLAPKLVSMHIFHSSTQTQWNGMIKAKTREWNAIGVLRYFMLLHSNGLNQSIDCNNIIKIDAKEMKSRLKSKQMFSLLRVHFRKMNRPSTGWLFKEHQLKWRSTVNVWITPYRYIQLYGHKRNLRLLLLLVAVHTFINFYCAIVVFVPFSASKKSVHSCQQLCFKCRCTVRSSPFQSQFVSTLSR